MAELTMRQTVSTAILDADPTIRLQVIQRLSADLMKSVSVAACFDGENIVSMGPLKEIQINDLCAVRFERSLSLTPLVRCRDCKHYNAGLECLIEGYGIERPADYFCADGKRKNGGLNNAF